MDHLLYDLVEEVVSYLPRADVETIARVSSRSPELENWSFAAEDQLENRFLLDVCACVQEFVVEEPPKIFFGATKFLPHEDHKPWNFTQWRYAWIQNVSIEINTYYSSHLSIEVDMQQVLRVITLPVDPSAEGSIEIDCEYPWNLASNSEVVNLSLKLIQAAQEGFASMFIYFGIPAPFEDFIVGYIGQSVFLKYLSCAKVNVAQQRRICAAVAPMFEEKGRPLELHFYGSDSVPDHIDAIVELWRNSDGTFGEKKLEWRAESESNSDSLWRQIKEKYNPILESKHSGYLAHPSRRSSLFISFWCARMEKFQPWDVPVNLQWIDSVINDWKRRNGFQLCRGATGFSFKLAQGTTWNQIVEKKYGPLSFDHRFSSKERFSEYSDSDSDSDSDSYVEFDIIKIPHPSNIFLTLKLTNRDELRHMEVEHKRFSEEEVQSLISDWRKGNGETLVNGLTEIEVLVDKSAEDEGFVSINYSHPLGNSRCRRFRGERVRCTKFSNLERISIVPIEDADDWNLELLFGSLQV